MKTPHFSGSKLPPASEYALIIGAGATAAMSMAAQQVAVATLPVTTLVALGLLNRYRLDQRLQDSETSGPTPEEATHKRAPAAPQRVTAQPQPDAISARPQVATTPTSAQFSDHRAYIHETLAKKIQAKADFASVQQASLKKVGAYLQQTRQEKSLSLEDIYQQTFIQTYTLRALETGNLKQLPEPFYIRAFIQKYASALGLEGAALAADFPMP
ncbi:MULTISPECIES: helix-turn-helix domain-containing protein [Cyanophyceae]|uniref:helix-turn-helix domain-containing protein n=1 Tax=Cyanophyceae TaxID=3028117 RepID=UPI0016886D35|nr:MULTISPECIES: helix-turn-helix domain-containing protein [Cyanophyceae]MBD1917701.1 helix-turn-helix domain-containing protein [Phormidium sp. FACHB-77]MBD2031169.1 helix-turn-helix domain-containing protein [Phormidium sp. FACHB-322]MBD2053598.1 helix-turn-helix domain-containing protein [Leptolyngbya sp. FACHB-60]